MAGHAVLNSICECSENGICDDDSAECDCFPGFTGPTCSVSIETTQTIKYDTTTSSQLQMSTLNISSIVAGILGGMLLAFGIGLIVYIFWKRRSRKKKLITFTSSTSSTTPVVIPSLYNIAISRRNSEALTNHIYEDLP